AVRPGRPDEWILTLRSDLIRLLAAFWAPVSPDTGGTREGLPMYCFPAHAFTRAITQSGVGLAARPTCCRWYLSRMIAARWTGSALHFSLLTRRAIPSSSRRLLVLLLPVSGPAQSTGVSPFTTPAPRTQPPATRGTVRGVIRAHVMVRHRHCQSLGGVCTHRLVLDGPDTSPSDPRCAAREHLCGTIAQ